MFDSLKKSTQRAIAVAVSKIDADWETYKIILKTSLAPAIGLAANEATPWTNIFGSVGYLVPIASIILHPTPPRAAFLRDLIANLLGACISAAVTALAVFCVVKAREQSKTVVINGVPYNAVASTVAAIWLIVENYVISAVRYNYPWLIWVASACLVFSNYTLVYAVQFKDMAAGFRFLRELLFVHLVAFGISTGVALFIFPNNCRQPYFNTVSKYTKEIRNVVRRHRSLMENIVNGHEVCGDTQSLGGKQAADLEALQAKLTSQINDAELEWAWGVLDARDIRTLTSLLNEITIPVLSLCQVPDVRHASLSADTEDHNNSGPDGKDKKHHDQANSAREFKELLQSVIMPFSNACQTVDKALQFFEEVTPLGVSAAAKKEDKVAGTVALEAEIEQSMNLLVDCKVDLTKAFNAQPRPYREISLASDVLFTKGQTPDKDDQTQINVQMVLYTLLLLWSTLQKSRQLVVWSRQVEHRPNYLVRPKMLTFAELRLIPRHRISKALGYRDRQRSVMYSSRQPRPRKPIVAFVIHYLRMASDFFASPASGFGLRVTLATMCAAIICFLPSTQDFYIKQHLVWAQYTISFTMQGSAGLGLRMLIFRVGGTVIAACLAWISWYIVVGVPAGVVVFYWLSMHVPMSIMALNPRFYNVGVVSAFALSSILGNALEPDQQAAPHSTLVLGAIRLGAISIGCLIGSICTIFPFPASDHDSVKDNLAGCLASLADYYAGFYEIVRIRLEMVLTKDTTPSWPNVTEQELEELHTRLLEECKSKVRDIRSRLELTKWNLPTDEHFPRSLYTSATENIDSLITNMRLITFASQAFLDFLAATPLNPSKASSPWLDDPTRTPYGFGVAALLSVLSYSIRTGAPLASDLRPPSQEQMLWKSFDEAKKLFKQVESIHDPGAATIALLRIGTRGLQRDLANLTNVVRELVGERKFVWEPTGDEKLT